MTAEVKMTVVSSKHAIDKDPSVRKANKSRILYTQENIFSGTAGSNGMRTVTK